MTLTQLHPEHDALTSEEGASESAPTPVPCDRAVRGARDMLDAVNAMPLDVRVELRGYFQANIAADRPSGCGLNVKVNKTGYYELDCLRAVGGTCLDCALAKVVMPEVPIEVDSPAA